MRGQHSPDLLRSARELGVLIAPDLGVAADAVLVRASVKAHRRSRPRGAVKHAGALMIAAVLLIGAIPALATGVHSGIVGIGLSAASVARPPASDSAVGATRQAGAPAVGGPIAADTAFTPVVGTTYPSAAPTRAPVARCPATSMVLETAFDHDVNTPGALTMVTLTLTNRGLDACATRVDPCSSGITVIDGSGTAVYESRSSHLYMCDVQGTTEPAQPVDATLLPGEAITVSIPWVIQGCYGSPVQAACVPLVPGRYAVVGLVSISGEGTMIARQQLISLPRHLQVD